MTHPLNGVVVVETTPNKARDLLHPSQLSHVSHQKAQSSTKALGPVLLTIGMGGGAYFENWHAISSTNVPRWRWDWRQRVIWTSCFDPHSWPSEPGRLSRYRGELHGWRIRGGVSSADSTPALGPTQGLWSYTFNAPRRLIKHWKNYILTAFTRTQP